RILAVCLLDATPANVTREVDHWREYLTDSATSRLTRNCTRDAAHERGVPRRGEPDRLRENRGAGNFAKAVQRFLEGNDRNAEPSLVDEVFLDCVDAFSVLLRGEFLTRPLSDLQTEDAVAVVVRRVVEVTWDHEQLPELLV